MANNSGAKQFPYPWRGIGVLAVFLLLAPPVYVAVAVFMGHHYRGGRQILFEIGGLFSSRILPALAGGYSFYMPPVFFAALWLARGCAQGRSLTFGAAAAKMVIAGFACEVFYQIFVLAAGGALRFDVFMVDAVQWILSAFICCAVCAKLGLAKAAGRK